ncbi:MAG: PAS domain S-box protein [Bryobacteraceae bacterium]|nr:PAS domain S-box protein [Bryobacteraceae bacterium]
MVPSPAEGDPRFAGSRNPALVAGLFGLIEHISDALVLLDQDLRQIYVNDRACQIGGLPREEFLGRTPWEMYPDLTGSEFHRMLLKAREQQIPFRFEFFYPRWQRNFEIHLVPFPGGVGVITRDIDEAGPSEASPQTISERYRLAVRAANAVVFDWNLRDGTIVAGESLETVLGYSAAEVGFVTESAVAWWTANLREEDRRRLHGWFRDRVRDSAAPDWSIEYDFRHKDGRWIHILDQGLFVRDAHGRVMRMVGTKQDVTGQQQLREQAKLSEERFRKLADATREGVAIIAGGRIVSANQALCRLFGYGEEELLAMDPMRLIVPEGRDTVLARLHSHYSDPYESTGLRKDGSQFPVEICGRDSIWEGRPARIKLIRDMTAQKEAERDLEHSRERYEALVRASPVVVWTVEAGGDGSGEHEQWWTNVTGQTAAEYRNHGWLAAVHPEDRERVAAQWSHSLETLQPFRAEYRVRTVDGTYRHIIVKGVPVRNADGSFREWVGTIEDITARKHSEQKVLELNHQLARRIDEFETLIRAAPVGIALALDPACEQVYVNAAGARIFDLPPGAKTWLIEPRSRRFPFRFYQDGRELQPSEFPMQVAARESRDVLDFEAEIRFEDGRRVQLLVNAVPLLDEAGQSRGSLAILMDFSERKRLLDEIRKEQAQLRTVIDQLPAAVILADPQGKVVMMNDQVEQLWRRRYEPAASVAEYDQFPGFHEDGTPLSAEEWPLARALSHGEVVRDELIAIQRGDGSFGVISASASPVWNETGELAAAVVVFHDVTERRKTETALQRSNDNLKQFAYAAAHDLQEPLRNVAVFAEIIERELREGRLEELPDQLQVIREGAHRMHTLVRDLLNYSSVVGDGDTLSMVDTAAALETARQNLKQVIEDSRAEIIARNLPVIRVHEAHLVQLLQNLVGNAIKYRGPELPRIEVSAEAGRGEWIFSVKDNGIGIAPEFHERIFGVFKRLHGRDIPGTGIGLALCARIVSHYGGRIWVESSPGLGATFRFTLPLSG